MKLRARLAMVAGSVPKNAVVADIGTDHAFLPIALIENKIAKKVIACDIGEGPLSVARANVQKSGLSGIELRLSDGLREILPNEADVVTIAGMGGDLIVRILNDAPWLKTARTRLILQPMSSADSLRNFLAENGLSVLSERAVRDTGRLYTVITAQFDGRVSKLSPGRQYIGALDKDGSTAARDYICWQLDVLREKADSLCRVQRMNEEYIKTRAAVLEIEKILKEGSGSECDEGSDCGCDEGSDCGCDEGSDCGCGKGSDCECGEGSGCECGGD